LGKFLKLWTGKERSRGEEDFCFPCPVPQALCGAAGVPAPEAGSFLERKQTKSLFKKTTPPPTKTTTTTKPKTKKPKPESLRAGDERLFKPGLTAESERRRKAHFTTI